MSEKVVVETVKNPQGIDQSSINDKVAELINALSGAICVMSDRSFRL